MHASLSESPATMNTTEDQNRSTGVPKTRYSFFGEPARDAWLSTVVICLMFATMLALFWFPLRRTFSNAEVN